MQFGEYGQLRWRCVVGLGTPSCSHYVQPYSPLYCLVFTTIAFAGKSKEHVNSLARAIIVLSGGSISSIKWKNILIAWCNSESQVFTDTYLYMKRNRTHICNNQKEEDLLRALTMNIEHGRSAR